MWLLDCANEHCGKEGVAHGVPNSEEKYQFE
jgi:hypothetical protein